MSLCSPPECARVCGCLSLPTCSAEQQIYPGTAAQFGMDRHGLARSAELPGSIPVARISGMRIEINFSWLIIFALLAASLAVGWFPQMAQGRAQASTGS